VQIEGLRLRVVGARGAQLLHVGAVAGLGHGEAPGQRQRDDVTDQRGVMTLGAQRLHRPAEQAPLDAGLHHEREVGEGQHLDGRHRPTEVATPAVAGVETQPGLPGGRELARQTGDPGAGRLDVLAVHRRPLAAGEHPPRLVPDVGPTAVQHPLHRDRDVCVRAHDSSWRSRDDPLHRPELTRR